jgi:hypothetical protein
MLWTAPARFLSRAEQVDDGGSNGVHGEMRGCSIQRREAMTGELGFRSEKKIGGEKKKWKARVRPGVFIGSRNAPRHATDQGEVDSSEEEVATASYCRAPVRGRG